MPQPALLAFLVLLASALLALRVFPLRWAEGAAQAVRHRAAPWGIGIVTALALWWVAGATLNVEPISTDEASYLLQARILASGHVTAPAPPLPEFFEQAWVMVTPRVYSKYPPGEAIALAPGVALGLPWLVPFLLNLVSGVLLFGVLRRGIGPAGALLTWSAWVLSVMAMSWQTTYFSEVTLLACWLGAAATTWRWLDGGGRRWLVGTGLLVGYGVLTRPLSIVLLALPLAWLVLREARRGRRWRDVATAAIACLAVALVQPAWNQATTGDALRSPLKEYTEAYIPWDRVGFAVESTAARRPAPPDLQAIAAQLAVVHREHTLARLPRTLLERARWVGGQLFTHWRLLLLVLAIGGFWKLRGPGWVALASALLQFFGHAIWGHVPGWTLYYAESAAAWYIPGAVAVIAGMTWLAGKLRVTDAVAARTELAVLTALPLLLLFSVQDSAPYRNWRARRAADSGAFSRMVAEGPGRAIYFVRYGPLTSGRPGLIRNDPWLADARDWIVYDRGAENDALRRLAPDRAAFLAQGAERRVTPLPPLPPSRR